MNRETLKRILIYFVLAVAIITVYKTFDNIRNVFAALSKIFTVLSPFFIGLSIAYLLYPTVIWIEKQFKKVKWLKRFRRGAAIGTTYIFYLAIITLAIGSVLPVIRESMTDLLSRIPEYYKIVMNYLDGLRENGGIIASISEVLQENTLSSLLALYDISNILPYLGNVWTYTNKLVSFIMGLIISVYVLFEREPLKAAFDRFTRVILSPKGVEGFYHYLRKTDEIFAGFFFGKIIDSVIIGILAAIGFQFLGIKYVLLMAFIIGATNVIPYFGPFIGAAPVIFITLLGDSPMKAVWVSIFILVLQQFDGAILGPKILGDKTGMSAFWVLFAILVGGGLFGFMGLFLGVPVVAVLRIFLIDGMGYFERKRANNKT